MDGQIVEQRRHRQVHRIATGGFLGDAALVLAGDEQAMEDLSEADLLWYDVTELHQIPR